MILEFSSSLVKLISFNFLFVGKFDFQRRKDKVELKIRIVIYNEWDSKFQNAEI